jgi:hypothetical protein
MSWGQLVHSMKNIVENKSNMWEVDIFEREHHNNNTV